MNLMFSWLPRKMWLTRQSNVAISVVALLVVFFYLYGWGGSSRNESDMFLDSEQARAFRDSIVSFRHLLRMSIVAAIQGGVEVVNVRKGNLGETSKGKTFEGANDPLTLGDLRSHTVMEATLKRAFSAIPLISEEKRTVDMKLPAEFDLQKLPTFENLDDFTAPPEHIAFWIDPLDATQEYTENLTEYVTTMVCVAYAGVPVIGVIHQPFLGRTTWSWLGRGVGVLPSGNFTSLPSDVDALVAPRVVVSRSHAGHVTDVTSHAFDGKAQIIPAGGAGYKALQVASGLADAYVHVTRIKKWDICAGSALLASLGGRMTSLRGEPISFRYSDDVVVGRGLLATKRDHAKYLAKFQELGVKLS